jgi:hypothetical protein
MMNIVSDVAPKVSAGPPPRRRLAQWWGAALAYLLFSILLPLHRFDFDRIPLLGRILLIIVPTAVFMLLQLVAVLCLTRLKLRAKASTIAGIVLILLWVAEMFLIHPHRAHHYSAIVLLMLTKNAIMGLTLTAALTFFGSLLSLIIKERNLLLPVALIAMPVDFIGAMTPTGFTHDMVKHAPQIVSSVSVSVPAITSQTSHGISIGPIAFIGPGDILFMALFFAAVQRFELSEKRTFWWMYGLLTISMILVIRLPNFAVGALVPMGLAVIIANARQIKLKREELFAVAYAGALVLALVGFFFWSSHRFLFHTH